MSVRLLVTSPAGPPDDPRTWSGTPARLIDALRADGRIDPVPHSSRLTPEREHALRRRENWVGLNPAARHMPGPLRRFEAAHAATARAQEERCAAVLHLGTYDLPISPITGASVPRVVYVDNSFELWRRGARGARKFTRWQGFALGALERRALRAAAHVFTLGRHVAANLVDAMDMMPSHVTALGSGLGGVRPFTGRKDYASARLLTVAKVRHEDKGMPLLLKAFALARAQRPELQLTVIGGAGYAPAEGQPGVRCTGWIEQAELQRIYEESALFVLPALYEPWGLSYLEALACRIPVTGLARYAFPEISGNGRYGFIVERPEPESLARVIVDALGNPARLARMGDEGQQRVLQYYRWERVAGTIADRVVALLKERGG